MAIRLRFGMLGLALGYFAWYTPYAALTKALSSGLLPGVARPANGLVLLPAAALGTLVGSAVFLTASRWWRYARRPSRTMLTAGLFMSVVIATTTMNFTFAGVSILFVLLMMRGGVLILSPLVDAVRRRPVRVWSWIALVFSLLAVAAALADVQGYTLTIAAGVSLALYFTGYIGRFRIMSAVAKTGDERTDRGYLVDEQIAAVLWQVALCAGLALLVPGALGGALREGFTSFLFTPAALAAFGVGLLYEALFIYGTLIYLDPREYTWCVPANRCASVLSGVVAAYGLTWITGVPAPGKGQAVATGLIGLAILALSYPALRAAVPGMPAVPRLASLLSRTARPRPATLLFVCGGNTARSAMAESIARAELATLQVAGKLPGTRAIAVSSAGLTAEPGSGMAANAAAALRVLGVTPHRHRSRRLDAGMCRGSAAVYCMTEEQRAAVAQLTPDTGDRTYRLHPHADIPDPAGADPQSYSRAAHLIRYGVRQRLREQAAVFAAAQPQAGG